LVYRCKHFGETASSSKLDYSDDGGSKLLSNFDMYILDLPKAVSLSVTFKGKQT
jgi:hypothetical protein